MINNAMFNPNGVPVTELPTIYGFNNGGRCGFLNALLISDDGVILGGHLCSNESYMLGDLGIIEGYRPDRHVTFREHYPNGYRMEFVSRDDCKDHAGLNAALSKYDKMEADSISTVAANSPISGCPTQQSKDVT